MHTIYNIRPKGLNVGNDAIAVAMQEFIYKACGELVNIVTIPATAKYDGGGLYGLTRRSIHDINQYGSGVILGGGNLYENGEIDVDVDALQSLQVPLMVFSVSRGRVYNKKLELTRRTDTISDVALQAISERADINLLRDTATVDYVRGLGCSAEFGGCPTVFLNDIYRRLPELKQIGEKYREYAIISVRNPELMSIPPRFKSATKDHVAGLIQHYRQKKEKVAILCHDTRDIAFANTYDVPFIFTGEVYSYLSLIANCKELVSYRLHSFLPALSFGTPAVKISYDERALSLIEDIGFGAWNVNLCKSDDVLCDAFDRLNNLGLLQSMHETVKPNWGLQRENMLKAFQRFHELINLS